MEEVNVTLKVELKVGALVWQMARVGGVSQKRSVPPTPKQSMKHDLRIDKRRYPKGSG